MSWLEQWVPPPSSRRPKSIMEPGPAVLAIDAAEPGSDSQPNSGLRKVTRNLSLDFAKFSRTRHRNSRAARTAIEDRNPIHLVHFEPDERRVTRSSRGSGVMGDCHRLRRDESAQAVG